LVNCIISPLAWVFEAVDTFVVGCACIYCDRCCIQTTKLLFCQPCGATCYHYKDKKFNPKDPKTLGKGKFTEDNTVWVPARKIFAGADDDKIALFENQPSPSDIAQGQLGDCWMMTAMSAMAEHPNALQNLFVTKEYSERGKYTVRLYDSFEKRWKLVTVDDLFPCKKAAAPPYTPVFAQPPGRELWPLVYEKAFAKHFGGYDLLDGGNIMVALQAFTGDPVFHLKKLDTGGWKVYTLAIDRNKRDKDNLGRPKIKLGLVSKRDAKVFADGKTFDIIRSFIKRGGVVGAGTSGVDAGTSTARNGLVRGHAYSVLDAREVTARKAGGHKETIRLLKLRNPWGQFEWDGAWSDGSPEWEQYKKVAKKLGHDVSDDVDDGMFWMPWEKFLDEFTMLDLCDRSTGFRDVALSQTERSAGFCGPCIGCTKGCAVYWGTCQGFRATCCGHLGAHDRLSRLKSSSAKKIKRRAVSPS